MKIIGVTGGICTGSGTAVDYIEEKGYPVIKKNELFRHLKKKTALSKHSLYQELVKKESTLKETVTPLLVEYIKKRETFFRLWCKEVMFVEVPFLYECDLERYFSKVVVITCGPKTQEERAENRYGSTSGKHDKIVEKKYISEILKSQISIAEKRRKCDFVIDNNKNIEFMYYQLDLLLCNYYRYSIFYISVILIGILSILLPLIIKYKDIIPAKELNARLKEAKNRLKKRIKN